MRWLPPIFSSFLLLFCLGAGFQTPWFYCQRGFLSIVSCMLHRSYLIRQLAPERNQFYILLVYVFWKPHVHSLQNGCSWMGWVQRLQCCYRVLLSHSNPPSKSWSVYGKVLCVWDRVHDRPLRHVCDALRCEDEVWVVAFLPSRTVEWLRQFSIMNECKIARICPLFYRFSFVTCVCVALRSTVAVEISNHNMW